MYRAFAPLVFVVMLSAAPIFESKCRHTGEFGDKFEGDMLLTDPQMLALYTAMDSRNGLIDGSKKWPDQQVVYKIEEVDFSKFCSAWH